MKSSKAVLLFLLFFNEIFNNISVFNFPLRLFVLLTLILTYFITHKSHIIKDSLYDSKIFNYYIIYVLSIFIGLLINGNIELDFILKKLFTYLPISIFYFFYISNTLLNFKQISILKKCLLFTAYIHFILIIFQFYQYEIFWKIPGFFSDDFDYLGNGKYNYFTKTSQILPVGLLDFSVTSGYLILIFSPFYLFIKRNYFRIIFIFLSLIAASTLGQRSVVIFLVIFYVYMFFSNSLLSKVSYKRNFINILFFALILLSLQLSINYEIINSRLYQGFEDNNRSELLITFLNFASDNIFGGANEYYRQLDNSSYELNLPHNLFLNSWVLGGFPSFILSLILFYKSIKFLLQKAKSRNIQDYPLSPFCISCILIIANSLFHNQGFSTFDNYFFLCISFSNIKLLRNG